MARQRILNAISFEDMNRRYEMVEEAHTRTFEWIFGDAYLDESGQDNDVETDANEFEVKRQARDKFIGWLSSEDGIFHISGKLGSGKSTLMRFLYEHRGTKAELRKWAGKLPPRFSWNQVTEQVHGYANSKCLIQATKHWFLQSFSSGNLVQI